VAKLKYCGRAVTMDTGRRGQTRHVSPFRLGILEEISLLKNRRKHTKY
jgi:hypothetical protein